MSNVTYEELECASDYIVFYDLDFDTMDVGSSFQIFINDELQYSAFPYQLPLDIEFECPGGEEFLFRICDLDNMDCCVETTIVYPCIELCDGCNIYEFYNNTELECEDGQMVAEWYIHSENTSEVGYDIFLEGEFLTFVEYVDGSGPYNFDIPAVDTEYFAITACDNDNPDCCFTWEAMNPCFSLSDCDLSNLTVEVSECVQGIAVATVDFDYMGTTSQFFDYEIPNMTSGTYPFADLPLTIDIENTSDQDLEIFISENDNPQCSLVGLFDNPCFGWSEDCEITTFTIGSTSCEVVGGLIILSDILVEGTNTGGFYNMLIDDEYYQAFEYGTVLGTEFPCDMVGEEYTVTVCDVENEDCCASITLENACEGQCEAECLLFDLVIETTACEEGQFGLHIDFSHTGTSESFTLLINNESYGPYNYTDLPVSLSGFAGDCEQEYIVTAIDDADDGCAVIATMPPVCCQCAIGIDFAIDPYCENNQIVGEWYIFGENTSEVGYDISVNGDFLLFVEYDGEGPYAFDIPNPETENYIITACDSEDPDCCHSWQLENPCYEGEGDCEMTQLEVDGELECDGDVAYGTFLIDGVGTSELYYDVYLEGEFLWTLNYEEDGTYELEFQVGNTEYFTVSICDEGNEECCITAEFLNPCYEPTGDCQITDVSLVGDPECIGGEVVYGTWYIDGENLDGSGFTITVNNEELYTLPYNATNNYEMEFFVADTEYFTFQVCTDADTDCCFVTEFLNPCYEASTSCQLSELYLEPLGCTEETFSVQIGFDYGDMTGTFEIRGNGNLYGVFNYSDVPINLEELELDCNLDYEFVVIDSEDEDCNLADGYYVSCCEGTDECDIYSIDFTGNPACDNNQIVTEWYIFSENTSESGFDISINGEFLLYVEYDGEGPYEFDIPNPETQLFTITACDNDNAECCYSWELENPCYEGQGDCEMTTLDFGPDPICEDGLIITEWLIDGNNLSEVGYDIFINGDFLLFVEYNANSWYAFDIPDPETEIFNMTVCDNDNPDCCISWDIGNPCYEAQGDCEMTQLEVDGELECDGDLAYGTFLIDGVGTSELYYDVYLEGQFLWTLNYEEDGTYELEFQVENTEYFTVTICDEDNEECCITAEFLNPCYEPEGCSITELYLEPLFCDEEVFSVQIGFEYAGTSSSFEIRGNGNVYGTFDYSELPINLEELPLNCDIDYEFVVVDSEDEDCTAGSGYQVSCCEGSGECEITTLDFGPDPICEDGLIVTEWLIDGNNLSEVGYDIFINGDFLLFVEYNDNSWYAFDIPDPEVEVFDLTVCDNDNPDCCISWDLENPCYEQPSDECTISEVVAEILACEEDVFDVLIDFEYENVTNQFRILGNGTDYGLFDYTDLPVTLTTLPADCVTEYEFEIVDEVLEECSAAVELGIVCCENGIIQGLTISQEVAGDSVYYIEVQVSEVLLSTCSYSIYVDEEWVATVDSVVSSFELGPFPCGDDSVIALTVINDCTDQIFQTEIDLSDVACISVSTVDVEDQAAIKWNTATSEAVVSMTKSENVRILLYDVQGKLIQGSTHYGQTVSVGYHELLSGVYILVVDQMDTGRVTTKKVVAIK